ncbi:hypothetical protein AB0M44_34095 [Streptosporangium subroseum]|uniref:hypothetical protein n=1 Tax=Streptosporangium subroseum TaxID=106412 RepID=UPI0034447F97
MKKVGRHGRLPQTPVQASDEADYWVSLPEMNRQIAICWLAVLAGKATREPRSPAGAPGQAGGEPWSR